METKKKAVANSKTVTVLYFGSEDNADFVTDLDYTSLVTRLADYKAEDVRSLPTLLAGNKVLKLSADTVVIVDGDKFKFVPTRSKRARADIENDHLVIRAATQLDLHLREGKPRFVLAPYYCKLVKI